MKKQVNVKLEKDGTMPPKDFDKLKKTIKKTAKACSD